MKMYPDSRFSKSLRRAVIAVLATGAIAAQTADARSNDIVVVQPKDLPELARQPGEAMFLHDTIDGKTLLYIEQRSGSQLVILDVTDPAHVTSEGSARLDSRGPFDFVSVERVQGLTEQGQTMLLGTGGFTVTSEAGANAATPPPALRDYQVVDTADSKEATVVSTVKQVREEITSDDTGTTFLLAGDGLHLIRRPAAEMRKSLRQMATYG
jgi:hypothetical protein